MSKSNNKNQVKTKQTAPSKVVAGIASGLGVRLAHDRDGFHISKPQVSAQNKKRDVKKQPVQKEDEVVQEDEVTSFVKKIVGSAPKAVEYCTKLKEFVKKNQIIKLLADHHIKPQNISSILVFLVVQVKLLYKICKIC